MANLSDYTNTLPNSNGEHVIQVFITEAVYEPIADAYATAFAARTPAQQALVDANPNFAHTLYYIAETF